MTQPINFHAFRAAGPAALAARAKPWRAAAREMAAAGVATRDIASRFKRDPSTVRKACAGVERSARAVPGWVERAGLAEDYVDTAALAGEHAAAAHCRRLKFEADRGQGVGP